MDKKTHYQIAFKQGGIQPEEAEGYIDALGEMTLDRLTKMGFDRRLIRPIIEIAGKDIEEAPDMELDGAINAILDNKKRMMVFMQRYCI